MTKTREEVDRPYKSLHSNITRQYYEEHSISKAKFDKLHSLCWLNHEKELFENALVEDYVVDEGTGEKRSEQVVEMITETEVIFVPW